MRNRKFCLFVCIIAMIFSRTTLLQGAQNNPPELVATAYRTGHFVQIEGTVTDENVDTVTVRLARNAATGAPGIPIHVVAGKFKTEVFVPIDEDMLVLIAEDNEGLIDEEVVDIAFAP